MKLGTPLSPSALRVMLLGSGELAKEVLIALQRLGFSNVGDQISIGELIASGHLVKPRTFVIDIEGTQEKLQSVKRTADEFDMREVEAIMNKAPINQAVVDNWKEKAAGRKTVVFCSTVDHAAQVHECFRANGLKTAFVHGRLNMQERQVELRKFTDGDAQIIVNVAVLTEGWDYPPTSCVILLRPSSYKSTMIQMVGRGLRTVDAHDYPGVVKTDCIVLDFGTSSLMHGSLEQGVNLNQKKRDEAVPSTTFPSTTPTRWPRSGEVKLPGGDMSLGTGQVFVR